MGSRTKFSASEAAEAMNYMAMAGWKTGEILMPSVRQIVGWIQGLVDWLNGLDEGTKKVIVMVALVAAALGPVSIPVSFSVSPKRLKVLTGFKQKEKIAVEYFDTGTLEMKKTEMFVEGYKAVLVKDTSYKGLWKVSFMLKEF